MDVLDEQKGTDVLPLEATTSSQVPINNPIPQPRAVRTQPSCAVETEQQQRTMNTALNASDSIWTEHCAIVVSNPTLQLQLVFITIDKRFTNARILD